MLIPTVGAMRQRGGEGLQHRANAMLLGPGERWHQQMLFRPILQGKHLDLQQDLCEIDGDLWDIYRDLWEIYGDLLIT